MSLNLLNLRYPAHGHRLPFCLPRLLNRLWPLPEHVKALLPQPRDGPARSWPILSVSARWRAWILLARQHSRGNSVAYSLKRLATMFGRHYFRTQDALPFWDSPILHVEQNSTPPHSELELFTPQIRVSPLSVANACLRLPTPAGTEKLFTSLGAAARVSHAQTH